MLNRVNDIVNDVLVDDLEFLQVGGYAAVFRLKNRQPPTVLKIIQEKHENEEKLFREEINALKKLIHENIVKYYGTAIVQRSNGDRNFGILMEFCEKGSLRDWLYKKTMIYSIYTVIWWSRQSFSALKYLEEQSTVHRDLKPANILVCGDFSLKICDFGTMKVNEETCTSHSVAGTKLYMSPEQHTKSKKRQLSTRSDVYSMGLVLWEMIERRQIFSNYPGGYDYANTTENELCKVERFECIEEFALIIKKCTKFNLTFRPKASEVLLELEVLEKSYGKLDFRLTPEMDLTQTRLLKPIGFNGCVEAKISEEEFADDKLSGVFSARLSSINDWVIAGSSEGKDIESVKTASSSSFPYIRGAYFTNWSQYRDGRAKFTLDDYLPGLCTHIFYAFAVFGNDFKLKETEPNDLNSPDGSLGQYTLMAKLKEKQAGLKVLLSIGGANFGTKLFEEMSSTRENRKIFIDSAISWVRRHLFDGIDISWLYPREQNCFADLLMELREEIDVEAQQNGANAKLILSAAVSPIRHRMAAYNIHNMSKCLDFVNLLTFHYWHSGCIETTGMNSPLYDRRGLNSDQAEWNINWAAHEWYRRGFPKEKIVIGVPTFGHGWELWRIEIQDPTKTLPGSFDNKATPPQPHSKINGFIAYHELCDLLEKGGEKNWHDEHKVPWFVENGRWWSYESQESIKIKMDFIKTKQFGGAVAWCLDFDDFNGQSNFHQGEKFPLLSTMSRELSD